MSKILLKLLLGLTLIVNGSFVSPSKFENQTINYNAPYYYEADYWYPGQQAGWAWVLDLSADGPHDASYELSVYAQVTDQWNNTYWKQFVFIVEPCGAWYHTHIMEMANQLSNGEYFTENAGIVLDHFWKVS